MNERASMPLTSPEKSEVAKQELLEALTPLAAIEINTATMSPVNEPATF